MSGLIFINELAAARRRQRLAELDSVVDTSITALECPACCAPVFAPADSNGELLTCADADCRAELVTAQVEGGVVALLRGGRP